MRSKKLLCTGFVVLSLLTLASVLPIINADSQNVRAPLSYEDFGGYSELDPNSHITVNNATHVSFDAWRNEDARLWRDMGENYFDDFQHELDFNWTDQDNWSVCPIWGLTNDLDDYHSLREANKTHIYLWVRREFDSTYLLGIGERFNRTPHVDRATINLNTMYYVTVNKVGTTFWAEVYDSASRQPANLIDQVQLELHGDWTFRYILACNTLDSDHTINGVVDIYRLNMRARPFADHDLNVALNAQPIPESRDSSLLNATVTNWGLSNETDVELFLLVDGTIVENTTIPELLTGSSYTLSYLWTPTVEAIYNVTAYAPPVSGENITANNVATKMLPAPTFYEDFGGYSELDPNSHITVNNATHVSFDAWRNEDARLWRDMGENYFDDFQHELDFNWTDQDNWSVCPIWGLTNDLDDYRGLADANKTHIWLFVRREFDSTYRFVIRENFNGTRYIDDATIDLDTMYYVTVNKVGTTFWAEVYDSASRQPANLIDQVQLELHGDWTFRYILACNTLDSDHTINGVVDIYRLNMRARPFADHDLAVALNAPSILELGDSTLLNATVTNWGLSNETDVELFLLVDGTIVENTTIPELLTGSSYTLSYLWTPTVEAIYNVTAYAPPVSGENITANNVATKVVNVWTRPEHDLAVALNAPSILELGDSTLLKATVTNLGSNAETDVELFLLVDGTVVDSAVIPELLTDSSYTLSYLWTPTVEGSYNVTAYAPPVPGENITANNVATKMVNVETPAQASKIYVDPETTTAVQNETFVIDVKVADVTNLFGFEYRLFWDPSLIELTGHTTYVPPGWEPPNGFPVKDDVSVSGRHWYCYCAMGSALPFTGNLTLATYTFTVISVGSCALDLDETKLADNTATLMPHSVKDGYVTCIDTYLEGDVNQDAIVDIVDVVIVALAFGSEPGDDNWDPRADVANTFGLIDIVDVVFIAIHFGETG